MSIPRNLSWKNPPHSQSWAEWFPNNTLKTEHILKDFLNLIIGAKMYPVWYSCHAVSAVTVGSTPCSAQTYWRCWGTPGGSSASSSAQLQQHSAWYNCNTCCLSNAKIKLLRMAGMLRKKLKEKLQCKVLVMEMAYPHPCYLTLLQTPHFTVPLLHCPSLVLFWKAYLILKYILDSSCLPQQHIALKYGWKKKRAVQLPTTGLYGSSSVFTLIHSY